MLKRLMIALAFMAGAGPAFADMGITRVPLGYQQITTLTAATKLTVPAGATMAMISVEAQAVRYRDDGVAPTATVGQPIAIGVTIEYQGTLSAIQLIQQTSGAEIDVSYYR